MLQLAHPPRPLSNARRRIYLAAMQRSVVFGLVSTLMSLSCFAQEKRVCITIDDLPCANCAEGTWQQVTDDLLLTLKAHNVPAIGFVNEGLLYPNGTLDSTRFQLLERWLAAGMELGNHTYAHLGATRHTLAAYEQDIVEGERHLRPLVERYGQQLRYFRHPYLQAGPTPGYRDSLNTVISRLGYTIAPVTFDNDEYVHAYCYEHAERAGDTAWLHWLEQNYLAYMAGSVHFHEAQTQAFLGRSIPQILLIHANTLNAAALDALLSWFVQEDYVFVPLDEVLKDPAYTLAESTTRYGYSWIRRWQEAAGQHPPWPPEVHKDVQKRFDKLQRR